MTIVDDLLDDFEAFEAYARSRDYTGITNPADGVFYPDISVDIPDSVVQQLQAKVQPDQINYLFMRLTSESTGQAPHQAHNDSLMGQWTMILYLQDGPGGTSLVRHKETGMDANPTSPEELAVWERDTNIPEAWEIYDIAEMRANRAAIFPSEWMHRAEPIGGFGDDRSDGRIVLSMFFNKERKHGKNQTRS